MGGGVICKRSLRCDIIRDLAINAEDELFLPSPEGFFQHILHDTSDACGRPGRPAADAEMWASQAAGSPPLPHPK